MTRNVKAPPGGGRTGQKDEAMAIRAVATSAPTLPEQARQLVEEAQHCHPDLASWAQGFLAGWDAAWNAGVRQAVMEIAETIAVHDVTPWVPVGRLSREARIRREVAEMERHARPVQQTADWPRVRIPGGGQ